jgi:predicted transcriptional regulator
MDNQSETTGRVIDLVSMSIGVVNTLIGHRALTSVDDAIDALGKIHTKVMTLAAGEAAPAAPTKLEPAVNPKRSITDEYLICLEDGKKFKSLKRHLMTHYGLSPDAYREKWSLAKDYPMVAPNYAAARSSLAKKMGLGRKRA